MQMANLKNPIEMSHKLRRGRQSDKGVHICGAGHVQISMHVRKVKNHSEPEDPDLFTAQDGPHLLP